MSNPFVMVHINAERDKQAKRDALRDRKNKVTVVDFGNRDRGYSRSYPIEDEIQALNTCADFRTYLTAQEQQIAQAERRILSAKGRKGTPNRSSFQEVKRYYYLLNGEWKESHADRETVQTQDTDYIADRIQQIVAGYGVRTMTKFDIYDVLNTVSRVYLACDAQGMSKPTVYANTFKKSA